jgi:lipid-A-disaccharide synthase
VSRKILISAGEASGDLYAATLVAKLRRIWPDADFYGCTGPRMREAGVRTVVDAASLAVVGLVEVIAHIPRIYGEYRKLLAAARQDPPDLAILTDSPDFHLRLATRLKALGIPIVYLVAPQVWAWRQGRVKQMRRVIDHLLCIFPFEEKFFRSRRIPVTYIGHPLVLLAKPAMSKAEFFRKHRLAADRPVIVVLPGSRRGEAARHLGTLLEAVNRLYQSQAANFLLPASATTGAAFFRERILRAPIQVIDGEIWDALAHADLALAASGTVTVEAALLGTPLVTFYKVSPVSWFLGKRLVKVPFFSMVNLIAERKIVPELMQNEFTASRVVEEAARILSDGAVRARMKADLAEVARRLSVASDPGSDPMDRACSVIATVVGHLEKEEAIHVSENLVS